MSDPLTPERPPTRWRCRTCRHVYTRDTATTRKGLLECGRCMHAHHVVGQLEPIADARPEDATHADR